MISQAELIKLIREKTGCGMIDAKSTLEQIARNMGVMTRRDVMALQIYASMSTIPDSLENRKQSADWSVQCADELIMQLDKKKGTDA